MCTWLILPSGKSQPKLAAVIAEIRSGLWERPILDRADPERKQRA